MMKFPTGTNVIMLGGAGNDAISNSKQNLTMDGGEGDDWMSTTQSLVSINGGEGDDVIAIRNDAEILSILGGAQGDTLYENRNNAAGNIRFFFTQENFGYDVIYDFKADDKIVLGTGMTYRLNTEEIVEYVDESETQKTGSPITLTVIKDGATTGTITLYDTAGFSKSNVIDESEETIMAELTLSAGTGTQDDPYIISSADDLSSLAEYVDAGGDTTDKHFKVEEGVEFPDEFTLGEDFAGTIEIPVETFSAVFTEDDHALSSYKTKLTASGVFVSEDDKAYEDEYEGWS